MSDQQLHVTPTPAPRRHRPSLATVIALLALVAALSNGASALPGQGTVTSDDIKSNAVTTPKIKNKAVTPKKLSHTTMWALVAADGSLIQGAGVEAINRDDTGIYQVRFAQPIPNKAIVATVYSDGTGSRQINVKHCDPDHPLNGCALNPDFDNNKTAFVNTEDSAGVNADSIFLVTVLPPSPNTVTAVPRVRPSLRGEAHR